MVKLPLIMKRPFLFCVALCTSLLLKGASEIKVLEFSVYGQYPVRNVGYYPVSEAALRAGIPAEPAKAIETHVLTRMGPYKYTGGEGITFFDLGSKNVVARVRIPEPSGHWLFVFLRNPRHRSDPENQLKYLVYPFDDSLSNLPLNRLVFLNISGNRLDGLLERKRIELGHGESKSFPVEESFPVNLWALNFKGDRLLPALIKTYSFRPGHRHLMILFPPVLRGSVDPDVRLLSDRAPADTESELLIHDSKK